VNDVLLEVTIVLDDVVDDPAKERDVGSRSDRDVHVRHSAGAGEARIDVDDLRSALLGFHDPAKADRMALGEVGTLDHDAVRVLKILLESGRSTPTERGPQTGDGG
jgi:hypothetical protein